MLPITVNLKPQADGYWRAYEDLVGAPFAYQAVDDSDSLTHDSDLTKFKLPRAGTVFTGNGRVSFVFFLMAEGIIPTNITINVGAKRTAGGNPGILIGFARGQSAVFDPTPMAPGASYTVESRSFPTSPFTALPWAQDETAGLEVCIQSEIGAFAGSNQVTLVSASLSFMAPHNYVPTAPRPFGIG